jgi:hypothetical protein
MNATAKRLAKLEQIASPPEKPLTLVAADAGETEALMARHTGPKPSLIILTGVPRPGGATVYLSGCTAGCSVVVCTGCLHPESWSPSNQRRSYRPNIRP